MSFQKNLTNNLEDNMDEKTQRIYYQQIAKLGFLLALLGGFVICGCLFLAVMS